MSFTTCWISVIFTLFLLASVRPIDATCSFHSGKYDLETLDWPEGWPVVLENDNSTRFVISLCRPLNIYNCINSSVCKINGSNTTSYAQTDFTIADNYPRSAFSLFFITKDKCNQISNYRASINFECGPHLGSPEVLLHNECQVNFIWKTSAACPVKSKGHEVPCYAIDNDGHKRDLSYLIKDEGGYPVTTNDPDAYFYINVCSNIVASSHTGTQNCNSTSPACIIDGGISTYLAESTERLQWTEEGLVLNYKGLVKVQQSPLCDSVPNTRVLFKCPSRGKSQLPKLISHYEVKYGCSHYEVIWYTEHACPQTSLKGSFNTCQLNLNGVDLDLSPLKNQTVYQISSNVSGSEMQFFLSVCQGLGKGQFVKECGGNGWKSTTVCMRNSSSNSAEVIGTISAAELKYVDGQITLIYPNGNMCPTAGIKQTSVINFICNKNASSDGLGFPKHVSSGNCVHIFNWETQHACVPDQVQNWCSVSVNNTLINLEQLKVNPDFNGRPWEAIDRRNIARKDNETNIYYINICGSISNFGNLSSCGKNSSACFENNGQFINLGQFYASPSYDSHSGLIRLEYYNGSQCKNGLLYKSTISFICRPGLLNFQPVLKNVDEVNCHYEFEWLTSMACPEVTVKGQDCMVQDSSSSITYDLRPLKSKVYEVKASSHKFYLSVCEPIAQNGSACSGNPNISACMVENGKTEMNPKVIGESNSTLLYTNDIVGLDYFFVDRNDKNVSFRTSITFICDSNAGNGSPMFIGQVSQNIFKFHWYTSLVCRYSTPIECVVHDPVSHSVYDLSELSSEQNWVVATYSDDGQKRQKIYFNICRPLNMPVVNCDSNAAACLVGDGLDGKAVVPNIGKVSSPPVINSPGHLTLTYDNGEPCTAFGERINYTTKIHFFCAEGDRYTAPRFLNKVGNCQYAILWATKAACPTGNLMSKNSCQLTDPESGFSFDLTSLTIEGDNKPYMATAGSRTFELNICQNIANGCHSSDGKVRSGNISVCETQNNSLFSVLGLTNDYTLSYSQGKDLTLTYKNILNDTKKTQTQVFISFPCKNDSKDPELKFIEENPPKSYIFEMQTSLSCIPIHFDCSFVNPANGDEYDLSPLSRYNNENWEVSDSHSNMTYHINFCRPLHKNPQYGCPGGTSSACQTDTQQPHSNGFSLGSQRSVPTVSQNGIVIVRYIQGSLCHKGLFKRSTTINLLCAHSEGELRFIGETPECEYIFSLETPVACPVQISKGSNCHVFDPVFGYMFDLSQLQKKNENYNITVGQYEYSFNICGKLNGFSNNCQNAGICQTKPNDVNFSKSLGSPSSDLTYRKGLITLEYNDGSGNCHGKYNRSAKITFTCDHAYEDKDGPTFISEAEDCTYLFEWPTVHACPSFDVIECSVRDDKGNYYDFSKLSLSNDNYYIQYPDENSSTIAINLCRSVVPTPDSLCPYTAAACLQNPTGPLTSVNLGRVGHPLYFENGHIKINYTTGDPCNVEKTAGARFMQTVIEFTCDKNSLDSHPEFIGRDGCTYHFDWSTAYACVREAPTDVGNCRTVDNTRGFVYDLSPLQNHTTFTTKHKFHKFHINICNGSSDNPCGNHSGMCQEEVSGTRRWSGGIVNSNLQFNDGLLFLNYSGGEPCHNNQFERNTIIQFQCGREMGEPVFIYESDDCTYFFIWETELACDPFVHCAIQNGSHYYDLSLLSNSYFVAGSSLPNDNSLYYISVCGPLPNINGIQCPHGAAICEMPDQKDGGVKTTVLSLGRVEHPPFIDFEGYATSIYTNGSQCSSMPGVVNRARIIFLCHPEPGVLGEPVLIDKSEDCLYLFKWKTSVVCAEIPETSVQSCRYTDKGKGLDFDLSSIQRIGSYYTVSESANKSDEVFLLNICGTVNSSSLENCKNSGICFQKNQVTESYGLASTLKLSYDGSRLRLSMTDGDDCPSGFNGKRHSDILFICDPSAGLGKPEIYKRYTCAIVFMWKTSLVCQNMHQQRQCSFGVEGNHYDLSLLSSLSHNWNTTDAQDNLYWFNLCRGILSTEEAKGCSPAAAVCLRDKNGSHISLGLVQTMQVKANNSDLLLTFGGGDKGACDSINSTIPLGATARLVMRCSHSLGRPKVLSGPDTQCFYDFLWETSLACPETTEEVMVEENGTLYDNRLKYSMDLADILNHSYSVVENARNENYVYEINLSKVFQNLTDPNNPCANAAVCQTKPGSGFSRDIGTFDTRKFYIKGSELHLVLTSRSGPCGKDKNKNVTTRINMACSSAAGVGQPMFLYESGNCDYMFEWETIAVCPGFHRPKPTSEPPANTEHYKDVAQSSHTTETVICVILLLVVVSGLVFVLVSPNRRSAVALRFRGLFSRVNLPHFQYKRCDNERLILIDAAQPVHYDNENNRDVELLT